MGKNDPSLKEVEPQFTAGENGTGNAKGKRPRSFLPGYLERFCHFLHEGYSQSDSGVMAGLAPSAGRKLAQRDDVKQRITEIEKEYGQQLVQERAKAQVLREEFIDLQVRDIMVNGEGKGKRGRLAACRLAYQKLHLIDPPNAKTLLALNMMQQSNGCFDPPKLYQPQRFAKLQHEGQYRSETLTLMLPAPQEKGGKDGSQLGSEE